MATSNFSTIVKILIVAAGAICTTGPEAVAQSQMQGSSVGGGLLGGLSYSRFFKQAIREKQAMRKECTDQGKQKGLKGRELRSFQKECVDGTLRSHVRNSPPPTELQ